MALHIDQWSMTTTVADQETLLSPEVVRQVADAVIAVLDVRRERERQHARDRGLGNDRSDRCTCHGS